MAHTYQALTGTPAALPGLVDGTSYTIQNTTNRKMFFWEGASAPTGGARGRMFLEPSEFGEITKQAGRDIYVWGGGGRV